MLLWKQESAGETALLIEDSRRVGKSTIVELFAEKEYRSYIIIDFAKASAEEKNLFNDLSDMLKRRQLRQLWTTFIQAKRKMLSKVVSVVFITK